LYQLITMLYLCDSNHTATFSNDSDKYKARQGRATTIRHSRVRLKKDKSIDYCFIIQKNRWFFKNAGVL